MNIDTRKTFAALLLVPSAILSLVFWTRPDFLISSDTLFPVAFVWDVLHHASAWSDFQQPRVPHYLPDLLVIGLVQLVTGSWRLALAAWIFVLIGWLSAIAVWITSRLAPGAIRTAAAAAMLLLTLVLAGGALDQSVHAHAGWSIGDYESPFLMLLLPYTHGGPFLMAMTAAILASRAVAQADAPARRMAVLAAALALVSCAATVSDLLYVTALLIPLTVAVLAGLHVRAIGGRAAAWFLPAAWGGGAAGWALFQMLDRQPLPTPTSRYDYERSILRFLADLGHHPAMLALLGGLALAVALDVRRRGWRGWLASFWSVFAVASALTSLAVTALLYADYMSYRYALPFIWLTPILLAATLSKAPLRHPWLIEVPLAAILAALIVTCLATGLQAPKLFRWSTPLASCLQKTGLRAGLAEYWLAGKTTAASDWRLQVEPITERGAVFVWGNDRNWFTHDIHDGSQPPPYRFIVMDRLPADRIAAAYGQPDRTIMCGALPVWIFDDSGRVFRNLMRVPTKP